MTFQYPPCTYRVSAKAVIVINGKLLLVKEDCDEWELPGGGVEHHEELIDAVRREILEETGLKLTSINTGRMQPWIMYHTEENRPLLHMIYPATTEQALQPGMYGDVKLGLFSKDKLEALPLVTYIEKFRQQLVELAFANHEQY